MKQILRYLKPYLGKLLAATVLIALSTLCDLLLPTWMSAILNGGIAARDFPAIAVRCLQMLAIAAVSLASILGGTRLSTEVVACFCADLRADVFRKVNTLSFEEFGSLGTAALVTRATHDVDTVSWVASMLSGTVATIPMLFLGGVVLAMRKDVVLSLVLLAFVPLLTLIVRNESVSVGIVVTILLYAKQFSGPLEQIAGGLGDLQHAKAAARRVFKLLDLPEEPQADGALPAPAKGDVRFEHVSFSYDPAVPLIEDLNLAVRPGQNVAIVGPTGAGKTTIVNLLMRFYDLNAGHILLDGTDCASLSREEVRSQFAMVLQDTWLFRGTIAENVSYGTPGATREQIVEACDRAYCDHFIRTLPQGYDTVVGDDMTNLSGGQKQLLTIARAMLANRRLLILDEATSNVDTRTEILLQKAMDRLMKGRTCFVIAHRLSTIVDSDLILVLDHGHIVEQGTHTELLARRGFYYQLYTSQYAI